MARHILDPQFTVFPRKSSKRSLKFGNLKVEKAYVALHREGSFGIQSAEVVLTISGHNRSIVLGTQRDNVNSPHIAIRSHRDFLVSEEVAELDQSNRFGVFYSHHMDVNRVDLYQMTRDFAMLQVVVADAIRKHQYEMETLLNKGAQSFDDIKDVDVLTAIVLCLREHNVEVEVRQ